MGGGETESKSRPQDVQAPEYQAFRPDIARVFRRNLDDVEDDLTDYYQGPLTTEMSEEEAGLVGELAAYDRGRITPGQEAAEGARLATIRGERLTPTEQFEPFARAINEAFREGTLENVGQFTAAGQRVQDSSPFARAEAISDRARADALARVAGDIYGRERDIQEEAARFEEGAPAVRAAGDAGQIQNLLDRLSGVGLPRLIKEMGIERGMEEHARRSEILLNFLGLGLQATQPIVGQKSKSQGYNFFI